MKKLNLSILTIILILSCSLQAKAQLTHNQAALLEIKSDSLNVVGLTHLIDFVFKQDSLLYNAALFAFSDSKEIIVDVHKRTSVSSTPTLREWKEGSYQTRLGLFSSYKNMFDNTFVYGVMNQTPEKNIKVKWADQEYKVTTHIKSDFDLLNKYLTMENKRLAADQGDYVKYKSKFDAL